MQPIKVGVVLPLTGDFQIYGNAGLQGASLAVEEINASGGIVGRSIELIVKDNQTDPSLSIQHARYLIQAEKVVALMGPVSSAARNAVLEEARAMKTPLLYGIDYEGGVYDKYLFCYSNTPDHYITPVIPDLLKKNGKSVYIFGYDYIWPQNLAKVLTREVPKNGGKIVGKEFTPFGVTDYSKTLQRIKDKGSKLLVLILPGKDGFEFIRQFNSFGLQGKVRILAIAADESYLNALSGKDLEGIYTGLHYFASLDKDSSRHFVQSYQKKYGDKNIPTYSTVAHYQLIKLLATGIESAGSLDREKMILGMENQQLVTASGMAQSRADHHFSLPMFIAEFTDGQLLVRKNLGIVNPPDQRTIQH